MTEESPRDFSRRTYAAPFGRYEGGRPAEYPGNEILIGRERERARMLDWLLSLGSRGAYLVTGYRGVGKTSFVNFSLQRYEEDVYGRYQQSRVGRVLFWDRILVAFVLVVALLVPLLASQLADIYFASSTFRSHDPAGRSGKLLGTIVVAALLLIAAYPLAYGWSLLRMSAGPPRDAPEGWIGNMPFNRHRRVFLGLFAITVFILVGPFGSPGTGIICFLALLGWTYYANRVFSISAEDRLERDPSSAGFTSAPLVTQTGSMCALIVGQALLVLLPILLPSDRELGPIYLEIAAISAMWGLLARREDAGALRTFLEASTRSTSSDRKGSSDLDRLKRAQTRKAEADGFFAFVLALVAIGVIAFSPGDKGPLAQITLATFILLALPIWLWRRAQCAVLRMQQASAFALPENEKRFAPRRVLQLLRRLSSEMRRKDLGPEGEYWFAFHPRPRFLILLKALFFLVVGAQLFPPALQAFARRALSHSRWWMPPTSLFGRYADVCGTKKLDGFLCGLQQRPFVSLAHELAWLGLALLFGVCLMYLEHDWIIRRHERARRDAAYDPVVRASAPAKTPSAQTSPKYAGADGRMDLMQVNRELMRATSFFWMFQTWLPLLNVRVNLGFDNLSHTQVVSAMLVGLRNEYYRVFVSWRSRLGLLSRAASGVFLVLLAVVVGGWLAQQRVLAHRGKAATSAWEAPLLQRLVINDNRCKSVANCRPTDHLLSFLLPYRDSAIVLYGYQALVLALLLTAARMFGRGMRMFHYADIYARLSAVLAALSSNVRVSRDGMRVGAERWGFTLAAPDRSSETDTPPQDPRMIEQSFLDVLRDVIVQHVPLPIAGHMLSLPAPQITFVFDELDKIGTRSIDTTIEEITKHDGSSADRERSRKLHRLLADMKNLLSVAPARFIFVGGRDLHDEWLADRTARTPLLSNIFDAEIYLPTLLVDRLGERDHAWEITTNIQAYLNAHLARGFHLHERWESRKRGFQVFDVVRHQPEQFFEQEPNPRGPFAETGAAAPAPAATPQPPTLAKWRLYDVEDDRGAGANSRPWAADFFQKFSEYLAFRSRGNPKRLDALIESLVRPIGRVELTPALRLAHFDCQHVLRFGQPQRVSMQLVSTIYRRLRASIAMRAEHGEDKNVRSAFYLADFLMKFHRRAFSWTDLERIDEVLHAHRAPDLRLLLADLVLDWSHCFLQPILNGMYAFRFRSEFAAEIRYVSRRSESEMAAFNFTLDESQMLKVEYQRRLEKLAQGRDESLIELRGALGELHDFDEDYEEARRHYAAAIAALDARARSDDGLLARAIDESSSTPLRQQVEWGISRLRLMLQIGMTYERGRNFEQALVEYRNTRTLARALWFAMVDDYARGTGKLAAESTGSRRLELLKQLHIIYQPLFAMAWIAEKFPSGIDSSLTMAEEGLWDLRQRMPFVRLPYVRLSDAPARVANAVFSLTIADLHHNAGNLYFFKGRHTEDDRTTRGYLDRAYYHYAVALHEVRRSHGHRFASASKKLDPYGNGARNQLPEDLLPEFVVRRTTSALFSLSNVWLAQISLRGLIQGGVISRLEDTLELEATEKRSPSEVFASCFAAWLARPAREPDRAPPSDARFARLERWLGVWAGTDPGEPRSRAEVDAPIELPANGGRFVDLEPLPSDADRIAGYIWFSKLAARLLAGAGHYEEAGHELLRVASCLEALLTSLESFYRFDRRINRAKYPQPIEVYRHLLEAAVDALIEAEQFFRLSRGTTASAPSRFVADRVPAHARRLVRMLGLAATRFLELDRAGIGRITKRLQELAARWPYYARRPSSGDAGAARSAGFLDDLREGLECDAYPVLNHLMTLRAIVFHKVLASTPQSARVNASPGFDRLQAHIEELRRLDAEYSSALHFTPFFAGTALALFALRATERLATLAPDAPGALEARKKLLKSQHMYSGRSAYYEAISQLYYLDDDFNDRCIQVRHAIQMMGSELTALLISRLDTRPSASADVNLGPQPSAPAPSDSPPAPSTPPSEPPDGTRRHSDRSGVPA